MSLYGRCRTSKKEYDPSQSASHTREMTNRVGTELYLFPKWERENTYKTHKIMTNIMIVVTKSGFESRLCKGEILNPLTSVVLNVDHLVSLRIIFSF